MASWWRDDHSMRANGAQREPAFAMARGQRSMMVPHSLGVPKLVSPGTPGAPLWVTAILMLAATWGCQFPCVATACTERFEVRLRNLDHDTQQPIHILVDREPFEGSTEIPYNQSRSVDQFRDLNANTSLGFRASRSGGIVLTSVHCEVKEGDIPSDPQVAWDGTVLECVGSWR